MDSKARSFIWLAALLVVLVWVLCAVPLAAQSMGPIAVRSNVQIPVHATAEAEAPADSVPGVAQDQTEDGVPSTTDALIVQMALAADVIFAGRVTAVRWPIGFAGSAQDAAEGIVEIDLHVDQSLRGPAAGSIYTLREWSGLWSGLGAGHSERYRVGQRLLLFLYAPDVHGLSSPVHGVEGAIPLRGSGVAPGPDDATIAAAEWLVDLRWLQAQVKRRGLFPMLPVRTPIDHDPTHGIVPESSHGQSVIEPDPLFVRAIREPGGRPAPVPVVETQPLSEVLALCHEAMRRRDAAR